MSSNEKYRIVIKLTFAGTLEYWPQFKRFGCWWSYRYWSLRFLTKSCTYKTVEEAKQFIVDVISREALKAFHNTVVECPTVEKTLIDLDKR